MILAEHNVDNMITIKYRDEDYETSAQKKDARKKKKSANPYLYNV